MKIQWLQRLALVLIVLASLASSIQYLRSTPSLGSATDDPVADWEKRFAPIEARLPFKRGVVGYISDSSVPGMPYDAANDEGEYVLTQYALAPIIIVKGTNEEWNIANLGRAAFEAWEKTNGGKFEVISFKGGMYLLHRTGN